MTNPVTAKIVATCLALALAGCAFGDVTVKTPPASEIATSSRRGEGREVAVAGPFLTRRQQVRCGMKKNGYNMDTASVLCADAPERALAELLTGELARAGFRVLANPAQARRSTIVLSGVLDQLFLEPKMDYYWSTFETDVSLELTATTRSGLFARRTFYFKGEEATAFASTDDMNRSMVSGVRQLVAGVVGAVANLADQLPVDDDHTTAAP